MDTTTKKKKIENRNYIENYDRTLTNWNQMENIKGDITNVWHKKPQKNIYQ